MIEPHRIGLVEFIRLIGWKATPWQERMLVELEEYYRRQKEAKQ